MKFRISRVFLALLAALAVTVPAAAQEQPSAWARESVAAAQAAGLVPEALAGGYTAPITSGEFCKLAAALYRTWEAQGLTAPQTPQDVAFTDCDDADVLLCASLGVVNGVGGGRFAPDDPIARQEAAVMLCRLASQKADAPAEPPLPHVFDDGAELRAWSRSGVYWACRQGVMAGVGDNRFDPDGAYTREQSIATVLRLYDPAWAAAPGETAPEEPPYRVVTHNVGVGVHRAHLEDADGNWLLTDFGDTEGSFYQIQLLGRWASLVTGDFQACLYNLETGETLEGYMLDGIDEAGGVGWASQPMGTGTLIGDQRLAVYADGTTGPVYRPATNWQDGRAVVWSDSDTLTAIDRDGNALWSYRTPEPWTVDYQVRNPGTRLRAQTDDGEMRLLIDGRAYAFSQGEYPIPLRYSTNYIVGRSGNYTLYGPDGTALYGPYVNIMLEVGQDLYARWINNWTYEYFRCAPGGSPTVLCAVYSDNGVPGDLPTDGAGVYALRTDTREITCFDRFGDTLGVLETPFDLTSSARITFEDGCVRVVSSDYGADAQSVLYLPTGERLA